MSAPYQLWNTFNLAKPRDQRENPQQWHAHCPAPLSRASSLGVARILTMCAIFC